MQKLKIIGCLGEPNLAQPYVDNRLFVAVDASTRKLQYFNTTEWNKQYSNGVKPKLEYFELRLSTSSITLGNTATVSAINPLPEGAILSATFESSDERVATVDSNGNVTTEGEGNFTITGTDTNTGVTASIDGSVFLGTITSGSLALDMVSISTDAAVGTKMNVTASIVPFVTEFKVLYSYSISGEHTEGLSIIWDNSNDGSQATIEVMEGFDQNAGGTITINGSANGTDLRSVDLTVNSVALIV